MAVLPFSFAEGLAARLTPSLFAAGLAVALLSSAVPFTLEMMALRVLPSRTFGILMSLEPAAADHAKYWRTVLWVSCETMEWTTEVLHALERGEEVTVRCSGRSMRGRIEDGQRVTVGPVDPAEVMTGDVVLVRWKGSVLLHLVLDVTDDQLLMGNNLGKVDGWVTRGDVLGRLVKVHRHDT